MIKISQLSSNINSKVKIIGLVCFFSFVFQFASSQNFLFLDSIQVDNSETFENGWFEQLYSPTEISYYWSPLEFKSSFEFYEYAPDAFKLRWYHIPLTFLTKKDIGSNYPISSAAIYKNFLILLGAFNLYFLDKQVDKYQLKKIIHLKGYFDKVYFLDENNILLASTYDYANKKSLWSSYMFKVYNLKKNKYTHHLTLDLGRTINLCYFPFHSVSVNSDFIAVSTFTKPEIFLYNHKLKLVKTIKIPDWKFNTDSVFEKCLNDSILGKYRFNPKNKIKVMNGCKLYHYPFINHISFFNNDTLLIIVNTSFNRFMRDRLVYLYALSKDSIVNKMLVSYEDKNIPRTFFMTSNPVQFNKGLVSYVVQKYIEKEDKLHHFLKLYTIVNKDSKGFYINDIPDVYNFKGSIINKDSLKGYSNIIFPDDYYCAHCFDGYANAKILILIKDVDTENITWRYTEMRYFKSLFKNSKVLFYKDNNLLNSVLKNKIMHLIF